MNFNLFDLKMEFKSHMESNILSFVGGIGGFELILILFFFFVPVILWIWAIIDLLKSNFSDSTNKLIWALVIIFIPFFGAILYLIVGRGQKV